MGFVGDDRELLAFGGGVLGDRIHRERKGLQRADDDRRGGLQCGGQLLAFGLGADLVFYLADDAMLVLELVDRVLELRVQNVAVGNDNN